MASRRAIERFARSWMRWRPETTEEQLRAAMEKRFLGDFGSRHIHVDTSAPAAPRAAEAGCLAAPFTLLLVPIFELIYLFFPIDHAAVRADIDAVLDQLKCDFTWEPIDS